MKFRVSKTYDIVTSESAANGCTSDNGFIFEDQIYTLRELKDIIKDGYFSRERGCGWFTSPLDVDYRTGEEITEYLHIELIK